MDQAVTGIASSFGVLPRRRPMSSRAGGTGAGGGGHRGEVGPGRSLMLDAVRVGFPVAGGVLDDDLVAHVGVAPPVAHEGDRHTCVGVPVLTTLTATPEL